MIPRPEWREYFLTVAFAVSTRGDCTRSRVGAVIVDSRRRIVATGYNGVAAGQSGCLDGYCPRGTFTLDELPSGTEPYNDCVSFHAEVNALLYSDRSRHEGGTLYVTREPCVQCRKLIDAAGIASVVWPDGTFATNVSQNG